MLMEKGGGKPHENSRAEDRLKRVENYTRGTKGGHTKMATKLQKRDAAAQAVQFCSLARSVELKGKKCGCSLKAVDVHVNGLV